MNMAKLFKYVAAALCAALAFASCSKGEDELVQDRVYLDSSIRMTKMFVSTDDEFHIELTCAIPRPLDEPVQVKYLIDRDLVKVYNEVYGANAQMLPADIYDFSFEEAYTGMRDAIKAGSVRSAGVKLDFTDVLSLDKDVLYVCPVRIAEANIPILESRSINYYVFQGARLINVVAYMGQNYCSINWNKPDVVNGLGTWTVEMLMNCDWLHRDDTNVSFFGIEGDFCFRCGDLASSDEGKRTMEICCPNVNMPAGPILPQNEWFALSVTCDGQKVKYYINQECLPQYTGKWKGGTVDLGTSAFHLNMAYNASRAGYAYFSEVRIWNRALSEEEIAKPNHQYFVEPTSEGLVAYWKFNEGAGAQIIVDRTGNGNDAKAAKPIEWIDVQMPD